MRLDLRFTKRTIEDLWCQAIVALVFQEEDMISDALSGLDCKMAGALSRLALKKIWTGARNEKALLATELMVKADKLLLYGLGTASEYSRESLEGCIDSLAYSLDKMCINDFGLSLPIDKGNESRYKYGSEADFLLKIVFSIEDRMIDTLAEVEVHLRECFTPVLDFSIIIDKKSVM
jgi:hypothetical protein